VARRPRSGRTSPPGENFLSKKVKWRERFVGDILSFGVGDWRSEEQVLGLLPCRAALLGLFDSRGAVGYDAGTVGETDGKALHHKTADRSWTF
jgi:hypothetical protein